VARSLERLGATEGIAGLRSQLADIDERLRRIERTLQRPAKSRTGR